MYPFQRRQICLGQNGWWWPTRSNSSIVVVFSLFLWHLKILGKVFGREEAIGDRKIYMARAFGGYRRHNHFLYFSSVTQLNVLHNRLIHDILIQMSISSIITRISKEFFLSFKIQCSKIFKDVLLNIISYTSILYSRYHKYVTLMVPPFNVSSSSLQGTQKYFLRNNTV